MKTRHLVLTVILAIVSTAAGAQMSTEIYVDRTVVPRLQPASPLPTMTPATVPYHSRMMPLTLSEYGASTSAAFSPAAVADTSYAAGGKPSAYRGYAWGGYFPLYNAAAGVGYRLLDTARSGIEAMAQFDGSSYKEMMDGGDGTVRNNTVALQATAHHEFSEAARLSARAEYTYASLRAPHDGVMGVGLNMIDADVTLRGRADGLCYSAGVNLDRMSVADDKGSRTYVGYRPDAMTKAGLTASLGTDTRDAALGCRLDIAATIQHRAGYESTDYVRSVVTGETGLLLSGTPVVTVHAGALTADVGLKADFSSNMGCGSFHLSPMAHVAWTPSARMAAYVRAHGGVSLNDMRRLYNYSPFAVNEPLMPAASTPVDLRAGINLTPVSGLTAGIYGRYASTHRAAMLSSAGFGTENVDGFAAGLDMAWTCSAITLEGNVELLQHGSGHGFADTPDRAAMLAHVKARAHATDRLQLEAAWHYRGCRQQKTPDFLWPMKNINDIDIGAYYEVKSTVTLFVRVENVLNRHADILGHVEQQGLHGLAGAFVRF